MRAPSARAAAATRALRSTPRQVTLVKDGDHRLSRDADIALLLQTIAALSASEQKDPAWRYWKARALQVTALDNKALPAAQADARQMIRRDRNHPSVIMWSTGNECEEQYSPELGIVRHLTDTVHRFDTTRPAASKSTITACWPKG